MQDEYYIKETGEVVTAKQINTSMLIRAWTGTSGEIFVNRGHAVKARAGDWLITFPSGHMQVCSAAAFPIMFAK